MRIVLVITAVAVVFGTIFDSFHCGNQNTKNNRVVSHKNYEQSPSSSTNRSSSLDDPQQANSYCKHETDESHKHDEHALSTENGDNLVEELSNSEKNTETESHKGEEYLSSCKSGNSSVDHSHQEHYNSKNTESQDKMMYRIFTRSWSGRSESSSSNDTLDDVTTPTTSTSYINVKPSEPQVPTSHSSASASLTPPEQKLYSDQLTSEPLMPLNTTIPSSPTKLTKSKPIPVPNLQVLTILQTRSMPSSRTSSKISSMQQSKSMPIRPAELPESKPIALLSPPYLPASLMRKMQSSRPSPPSIESKPSTRVTPPACPTLQIRKMSRTQSMPSSRSKTTIRVMQQHTQSMPPKRFNAPLKSRPSPVPTVTQPPSRSPTNTQVITPKTPTGCSTSNKRAMSRTHSMPFSRSTQVDALPVTPTRLTLTKPSKQITSGISSSKPTTSSKKMQRMRSLPTSSSAQGIQTTTPKRRTPSSQQNDKSSADSGIEKGNQVHASIVFKNETNLKE